MGYSNYPYLNPSWNNHNKAFFIDLPKEKKDELTKHYEKLKSDIDNLIQNLQIRPAECPKGTVLTRGSYEKPHDGTLHKIDPLKK